MRRFRAIDVEEYDDSWGGDQLARVSHGSEGSPPRLSCVVPIPAAAAARRRILQACTTNGDIEEGRTRPSKSARVESVQLHDPSQRASTGSNQHLVISIDSPSQKSRSSAEASIALLDGQQPQRQSPAQSPRGSTVVTNVTTPQPSTLSVEVFVNGQKWIVNGTVNHDDLIPQFLYTDPSGGCSELSQGDCLKIRTFLGRCFRKLPIPETSSDDGSELSEVDSENDDDEDEGVVDSSDVTESCSDDSESSGEEMKRTVRGRRANATDGNVQQKAPTQRKKSSAASCPLTVPQIKEKLKALGLAVSGRKSKLLARLHESEAKTAAPIDFVVVEEGVDESGAKATVSAAGDLVIAAMQDASACADEPPNVDESLNVDTHPAGCIGFVSRALLLASILETKRNDTEKP